MIAAAAEDVGGTVRRTPGGDPFARRDPRYIQRTLPALRLASNLYFRADVRGLEHIPRRARCSSSATTRAGAARAFDSTSSYG